MKTLRVMGSAAIVIVIRPVEGPRGSATEYLVLARVNPAHWPKR